MVCRGQASLPQWLRTEGVARLPRQAHHAVAEPLHLHLADVAASAFAFLAADQLVTLLLEQCPLRSVSRRRQHDERKQERDGSHATSAHLSADVRGDRLRTGRSSVTRVTQPAESIRRKEKIGHARKIKRCVGVFTCALSPRRYPHLSHVPVVDGGGYAEWQDTIDRCHGVRAWSSERHRDRQSRRGRGSAAPRAEHADQSGSALALRDGGWDGRARTPQEILPPGWLPWAEEIGAAFAMRAALRTARARLCRFTFPASASYAAAPGCGGAGRSGG